MKSIAIRCPFNETKIVKRTGVIKKWENLKNYSGNLNLDLKDLDVDKSTKN